MPPRVVVKKPANTLPRPAAGAGTPVNQHLCDQYRQWLTDLGEPQEFYAIYDLGKQEIIYLNCEEKLPLPEKQEETPETIVQLVPDFLKVWYRGYTEAALRVLARKPVPGTGGSFMIRFPLKLENFDGHQLVVQTIRPFSIDERGNILSFFSRFLISGEYFWEPLSPTVQQYVLGEGVIIFNEIVKEIFPWMELASNANLQPRWFDVTDSIRTLQRKFALVNQYTIADDINARPDKDKSSKAKVSGATVFRYLNRTKTRLLQLLSDEKRTIVLPPFLEHSDAITIIIFCQACGIIDLLKYYYFHRPLTKDGPKTDIIENG